MRVPQSVMECLYRHIHLYMFNQYAICLRNHIREILKQLLLFGIFSYHFLKGRDIANEYSFVFQVQIVVQSDHTLQYVTMCPFYSLNSLLFASQKKTTYFLCVFFLLIIVTLLNFHLNVSVYVFYLYKRNSRV